jgi:hypothetical protein
MLSLEVARVVGDELVHVGVINRAERGMAESFAYSDSYLERAGACPLSMSLRQMSSKPCRTQRKTF